MKQYFDGSTWNAYGPNGEKLYPVVLPHSEVCMHMRIAGKPRFIQILDEKSCQVWAVECHGDGNNASDEFVTFSAPILLSEAGVYRDEEGAFYTLDRPECHKCFA